MTLPVLDYQYSYLLGAMLFVIAWVLLYLFAREHRAQMLWGTLVAAPFALTSFLFIPEYWTPPSLFDLAARYGISIEDVVWSAAVGGIASSLSEILFRQRLERMRRRSGRRRYGPLLVMVGLFIALEVARPALSIYNMILAFLAGAAMIAVVRRDLVGRMVRGAAIFAVVYLLLFVWLLSFFPEFITRYYNTAHLLGVYVLGVPVEEPVFAFTGGAVWTVLYEYVHSYRLVSAYPLRFASEPDGR
jgi:hypothetical protein